MMLYRIADAGLCSIGEFNTTVTCNDVIKFTEILDYMSDLKAEYQEREARKVPS